jgi:uncharacterized membrane protein YfcA
VILILVAVAFGVLAGIASGLLGVGGGTLMVPFLLLVAGVSQQVANATSLLVILPTAFVGTWTLHRKGIADVRTSLRLGVLGVAGGLAGSLAALELPGTVLRLLFAGFLALTGARLVLAARPAASTSRDPSGGSGSR